MSTDYSAVLGRVARLFMSTGITASLQNVPFTSKFDLCHNDSQMHSHSRLTAAWCIKQSGAIVGWCFVTETAHQNVKLMIQCTSSSP